MAPKKNSGHTHTHTHTHIRTHKRVETDTQTDRPEQEYTHKHVYIISRCDGVLPLRATFRGFMTNNFAIFAKYETDTHINVVVVVVVVVYFVCVHYETLHVQFLHLVISVGQNSYICLVFSPCPCSIICTERMGGGGSSLEMLILEITSFPTAETRLNNYK